VNYITIKLLKTLIKSACAFNQLWIHDTSTLAFWYSWGFWSNPLWYSGRTVPLYSWTAWGSCKRWVLSQTTSWMVCWAVSSWDDKVAYVTQSISAAVKALRPCTLHFGLSVFCDCDLKWAQGTFISPLRSKAPWQGRVNGHRLSGLPVRLFTCYMSVTTVCGPRLSHVSCLPGGNSLWILGRPHDPGYRRDTICGHFAQKSFPCLSLPPLCPRVTELLLSVWLGGNQDCDSSNCSGHLQDLTFCGAVEDPRPFKGRGAVTWGSVRTLGLFRERGWWVSNHGQWQVSDRDQLERTPEILSQN
jgi:hypothetical protein